MRQAGDALHCIKQKISKGVGIPRWLEVTVSGLAFHFVAENQYRTAFMKRKSVTGVEITSVTNGS